MKSLAGLVGRPLSIEGVKATDNFKLYLRYVNGEIVVVDMKEFEPDFEGLIKKLSSLEFFKKVSVKYGMPSWPMGIELDPEELYELGTVISRQEFEAA